MESETWRSLPLSAPKFARSWRGNLSYNDATSEVVKDHFIEAQVRKVMTEHFSEQPNFHGFTVVVYTAGPITYVGRWDEQVGNEIFLNHVAVHRQGDGGMTRDEFILKTLKFGPRATYARYAVAADQVARVETLGELSRQLLGI